MKRMILAVVCSLFFVVSAQGAPLEPSHVPADAKWVVHIDGEAFSDSVVADWLREHRPRTTERAREWLQDRYGIDPQDELKGLTMFSDSYEAHTGTAILFADFDRDKVKSRVEEQPGLTRTEWRDFTLYTWNVDKSSDHRRHDGDGGDKKSHRDDRAKDKKKHKDGYKDKKEKDKQDLYSDKKDSDKKDSDKKDKDKRDGEKPLRKDKQASKYQHDQQATDGRSDDKSRHKSITVVLYDDKTVVFAPTPERAQAAVRLLEENADSLEGSSSKLIENVPAGAIVYGAAIDLDGISAHERPFPVLKQHEHVVWTFGEKGDEMFETLRLVAKQEEVADRMKQVVEGLLAFGKVWAGDVERLVKIYDDVEISQDGATLRVDWRGDTQEVKKVLDELQPRFETWGKKHRHDRK